MSANETDPRCGTYAGAQAHKRRKDAQCPPCLNAQREYIAKRREESAFRKREFDLQQARLRALGRLGAMHPAEYRALYAEETADLVTPPRKPREQVSFR